MFFKHFSTRLINCLLFLLAIPGDIASDPLLYPYMRLITKFLAGVGDVGICHRRIPRLIRHVFDQGFFPQRFLDCGDKIPQLHRIRITKIIGLQFKIACQYGGNTRDYVCHKGIIAPAGAIAEQGDFLPSVDFLYEIV